MNTLTSSHEWVEPSKSISFVVHIWSIDADSFSYTLITQLKLALYFNSGGVRRISIGLDMETHKSAVTTIEASIRKFHDIRRPFRIYHGSTNSTRDSQRQLDNSVDTSKLTHVLQVNQKSKTAIVEPNVPMDAFLQATLEYGLVPLVVMEFPGITVGGGFSGTSAESSSFRHGFFDTTVNWIEIVLATGETVKASRDELPELFWGAAAAFGTLGVVTLLEVQLKDATEYVELTYSPFTTMGDAMKMMQMQAADSQVDFLDGIVFSRDEIVVCSGSLRNQLPPGAEVQQFTRRHDPWFYIHVQRRTRGASNSVTIFVPLVDYLFRYDRGGFWVGRYAYKYFVTPFNRITRYVLDRFMHTRVMYHALHASGQSKMYIIQDVAVPYEATTEFHHWLDDTFNLYPIWLCPLRQRRDAPNSQHGLYSSLAKPSTPEMIMNFGVWGPGSTDRREFVRQNRMLEHKVGELGGRKWLYAHAYYTEEEFWEIFNREDYDALRVKYGADYLASVYDKVKVDTKAEEDAINSSWLVWLLYMFWSIWPLSGLYGVYKAWRGGDYLLRQKSMAPNQAIKID